MSGAVCEYSWDIREACAICYQLGYQGNNYKDTYTLYTCIIGGQYFVNSNFGNCAIVIYYFFCSYYQNNIFNCYIYEFLHSYSQCTN